MSRMIQWSEDDLLNNTVEIVDRIMEKYGAGLEEACAVAGITAIDYSQWKEILPEKSEQETDQLSDEQQVARDKALEEIVMHKIPNLLKIGITLENACEFARITVQEYEDFKKRKAEQ